MSIHAIAPEPAPIPNDHPSCHDTLTARLGNTALAADILLRKAMGLQKYGTILQPHNGRRPLVDAYQEVLDAMVYCEQAHQEHEPDALILQDVLAVVAERLRARL